MWSSPKSPGAAHFDVRLNRLTLASPAPWRQNGNLTVEINAGKTREWRTQAKIPTLVGLGSVLYSFFFLKYVGDLLLPISEK